MLEETFPLSREYSGCPAATTLGAIFPVGFPQKASPEELLKWLETAFPKFADEVKSTFTRPDQVAQQIFLSLNYRSFADRIQTPEDFLHYAHLVMEVARLFLGRNDEGYAGRYTANAIANMLELTRENFDKDLGILIQMMRDNPSPNEEKTIAGSLIEIKALIRSSADLERFGQFIKKLSGAGFDAKQIIDPYIPWLNHDDPNKPIPLFGRYFGGKNGMADTFDCWKTFITGSKELDAVLSVMGVVCALSSEKEFLSFLKDIHAMTGQQLVQFVELAGPFANKRIPPLFVARNILVLNDCDFSKEGLAIFSNVEAKRKWLEHCGYLLATNPRVIAQVVSFFDEALLLPVSDTVREAATEYLVASMDQLLKLGNFSALNELVTAINGANQLLLAVDKAASACLEPENEGLFTDPLARKLFPETFYAAVQRKYEKLFLDSDFISAFEAFYVRVKVQPPPEMLQSKYSELLRKFVEMPGEIPYNNGYGDYNA